MHKIKDEQINGASGDDRIRGFTHHLGYGDFLTRHHHPIEQQITAHQTGASLLQLILVLIDIFEEAFEALETCQADFDIHILLWVILLCGHQRIRKTATCVVTVHIMLIIAARHDIFSQMAPYMLKIFLVLVGIDLGVSRLLVIVSHYTTDVQK